MKIKSIENIPVFLQSREGEIISLMDFCSILIGYKIIFIDDHTSYILINDEDDDIVKEFVDLYIDESSIQPYTYKVKYEEKYNIAKSSSNELFDVNLSDRRNIKFTIISYENKVLKLELI
jgi:hypothetical protein